MTDGNDVHFPNPSPPSFSSPFVCSFTFHRSPFNSIGLDNDDDCAFALLQWKKTTPHSQNCIFQLENFISYACLKLKAALTDFRFESKDSDVVWRVELMCGIVSENLSSVVSVLPAIVRNFHN